MPVRTSNLDPTFDRALRDVIFDRALPCPHCRYDLRGIPRPICPECGKNVESHLRIADLSPDRLRRERFERILRGAFRTIAIVAAATPFIAAAVVVILLL